MEFATWVVKPSLQAEFANWVFEFCFRIEQGARSKEQGARSTEHTEHGAQSKEQGALSMEHGART